MPEFPVAWFATKGTGTNEAERIKTLLSGIPSTLELPFSKKQKWASFTCLLGSIWRSRPALLVMEGTGIAGGFTCILARIFLKIPYVVSSGDAVGPFIAAHFPFAGFAAGLYERLLCRFSAGFIGWTPYLCGRALTLGARRAVTAPGWVIGGGDINRESVAASKHRWGIPADAIVVGLLGALEWNRHREYCYGLELVRCARELRRSDVVFLVVGDGTGLSMLREEAGALLGSKVFLPGAVPLEEVMQTLAIMDIASLPQSMDGVGLFRYTTKLSEYAEARLPVITTRIPMAYDLGEDWMWRLPGEGPWTKTYGDALVAHLEGLCRDQIDLRAKVIPRPLAAFERESQIKRVTSFIREIIQDRG